VYLLPRTPDDGKSKKERAVILCAKQIYFETRTLRSTPIAIKRLNSL
jgi:hypothetical protein